MENFKIKKYSNGISHKEIVWVYKDEAVIEYIKQKLQILKGELWWDTRYGLDFQNMNKGNITFWLYECLKDVKYIKEITNIEIYKNEDIKTFKIYLIIKLIDNKEHSIELSI